MAFILDMFSLKCNIAWIAIQKYSTPNSNYVQKVVGEATLEGSAGVITNRVRSEKNNYRMG